MLPLDLHHPGADTGATADSGVGADSRVGALTTIQPSEVSQLITCKCGPPTWP